MSQTTALFIDAYRDLNSRKLFWITLILSALVVIGFAFVGMTDRSITFAGMHFNVWPLDPMIAYKQVFSYLVIGIWLSWAAVALALISTAGIFPELITGGTIDLYLSKPIGRWRLFLTKYATGLLFVTLQVCVFTVACFILFRVRAHVWQPSLLLAVPLVVCLFSYLFGFLVLLGVWTRSTIAAILLTIILWLLCWCAQTAESVLLTYQVMHQHQVDHARETIAEADARLKQIDKSRDFLGYQSTGPRLRRDQAAKALPDLEQELARFRLAHNIALGVITVIPKTTQTNNLLDRWLFTNQEVEERQDQRQQRVQERRQHRKQENDASFSSDQDLGQASAGAQSILRSRSPWYIIGTSLACEGAVVLLAGWIFYRRDY